MTMNISDVLAKMGYDAPRPMRPDCELYGRWFRMMAPVASLSDEQIATLDIGQLTMQMAIGLPGTDWLTLELIESYVEKLNDWSEQIRDFTRKRQNSFKRRPWEYENSQGRFRMICLATYLYKNLGVRYNQTFVQGEYDASDSRDVLLHGLLSGHGGTCATMPFLYLAIGRRLGYPLKLVNAKEHSFVRWDEPRGERFNIETTSPGFNSRPDSYYRQWPRPIPDEEVEKGYYLRSMQPRQEVASILRERAACLIEHLRLSDALLTWYLAARLTENDSEQAPMLGNWAVVTMMVRAVEEAREAAGLRNYEGIDLRKVRMPEPRPPIGQWAANVASNELLRIARNRQKVRDSNCASAGLTMGPKQGCEPRPEMATTAQRVAAPVDMADPADILVKMGYDWPGALRIDGAECSPWFNMMADTTLLPEEVLGNLDIGFLNLETAIGLPGAESLNVDACVETLNAWSRQVRVYTEGHLSQFEKSPEKFNNSPACFRMASLLAMLQKHLGVRYDPTLIDGDYNATDSRNLFVHGPLSGHAGTRVTLPVVYVAIGRRLGYPLKLVRAKQHLFARWEGPNGERFNIECTGTGSLPLDDDHFRRHPTPLTDKELQSGFYLRSLQRREELADFLCLRTECLIDSLRPVEALQSAFFAAFMAPNDLWLRRTWVVTTLLARALEQARKHVTQEGFAEVDLRSVRVLDGEGSDHRWAAPIVREHLQRIARIHQRIRHHTPAQLPFKER
jgi:regulator of sirC expression with transglutaminase-like and TPR domain